MLWWISSTEKKAIWAAGKPFFGWHVGHHPITIIFLIGQFLVTRRWSQLCTVYKSVIGMLAMHTQKVCGHQFLIHSSLNYHAAGKDYDLGNYLLGYNVATRWNKNTCSVQNQYNYCILCSKCKLMGITTWYFPYMGVIWSKYIELYFKLF